MRPFFKQLAYLLIGGLMATIITFVIQAQPGSHPQVVYAQQPELLSGVQATNPQLLFQGQLLNPTTGQPFPNGGYVMQFNLYNVASGGSPLWLESKQVNTTDGLFATLLGSVNPLNAAIFNGQQLYLGIAVGSDPEAQPRQPLSYSAYAIRADTATNADRLGGLASTDFVRQGSNGLVAYGIVDKNGGRVSGVRFSSRRASDGIYEITIDGETYDLNKFATAVTVIDNNDCPNVVIGKTGSSGGKLNVYLYDLSNDIVACKFHFIVIEP